MWEALAKFLRCKCRHFNSLWQWGEAGPGTVLAQDLLELELVWWFLAESDSVAHSLLCHYMISSVQVCVISIYGYMCLSRFFISEVFLLIYSSLTCTANKAQRRSLTEHCSVCPSAWLPKGTKSQHSEYNIPTQIQTCSWKIHKYSDRAHFLSLFVHSLPFSVSRWKGC